MSITSELTEAHDERNAQSLCAVNVCKCGRIRDDCVRREGSSAVNIGGLASKPATFHHLEEVEVVQRKDCHANLQLTSVKI